MKVYVQVPVTGREWKEALREADALSEKVVAAGHEAVNPLRLMDNGQLRIDNCQLEAPETMAPSASETARAMGRCIEALLGCDALLLHPAAADTKECTTEVRYSKGCRTEALAAITYGLRVLVLSEEEGRLDEDATRYRRASVVTRSLGMVSDGYMAFVDRGEHTGSTTFGKTMDLAATLANEMANNPLISRIVKLATTMSECFGGIKKEADGADGADE